MEFRAEFRAKSHCLFYCATKKVQLSMISNEWQGLCHQEGIYLTKLTEGSLLFLKATLSLLAIEVVCASLVRAQLTMEDTEQLKLLVDILEIAILH